MFRADGALFVTLGERQAYFNEAQSLDSQLGKVTRINPDGTIPTDNPFAALGGLAAAVWSYGHRNPQAATLHPASGELWVAEHGPQGGDEVNLALASRNIGWPNVSYGCNYGDPVGTACRIGGGIHNAGGTAILNNSTVSGNMAGKHGGGIYNWDGAVTLQNMPASVG